MTKFTGCLLLLFFTFFSFAQIEVNSEATADQVIETLVGSGVEVSNVTINCPDVSYGTFEGASNMGIGDDDENDPTPDGIIITSGDAKLAEGPNNEEGAFLNNFSWVEDEDLQALIPDYDIMDACVIEFDFIPAGDSLSFRYVFGSEEYPEFLEGDFNDVFGFFVSGPGIQGEFSNGARNIAVVPGTDMPVSIQTINNGPVKFDMENGTTSCDGPCVNCEYFMCNGNGDNFFNEPWFYDPTFIQYNGFTTILTAGIKLIPGEKYHIKLAVADAGDSTYDTGVFLEGKSFSTNAPQLEAKGIEGEEEFPTAVAGCTDGQFIFTFKEPVLCDVTVEFEVGGTSEAGVDYTAFSNSILIPENSSKESILVEILDDGVVGESKTLELYITSVSNEECANVILDTISLTIDDAPVFAVSDADIEKGETATIEASGGWSYMWSGSFDNPTERSQSVSPEESTDYEVTINYGRCSETLTSRVAVAGPVPECEFEVSSAVVEICNDAIYAIDIGLSGAALGDDISVADADGNLLSSFTYINEVAVRVGPIQRSQFVLTITNDSNITCTPIEYDATDAIEDCLNPSPCSIAVTMGSIASCTRNAYDLQLMLVGTDNGDSFSVSTANGTDLGTYNYSDMPVLIADIPVDQTVLFINDNMYTDCTTQTIDIFPVVQACVNLVPLCTLIEATPTVIDCTENDFTLNLMVNSNSTGNSFRVSDNLGNSIGIYNYDDVPVTIGPLSLDVTSLTINDSGNSECTTETDDLTDDVKICQENIVMCSLTVASAEVTSCTMENYNLSLNVSGMDVGTSFSVSDASGNDLGTYNYADVPVEVSGISKSENILTITDSDTADCSTNTDDLADAIQACDFPPPPGDCSISAATATFVDCTETDYSIMLEVTGENTSASFTVSDAAGNDLGTYNYADTSVEIGGIATTETVLTVTDSNDAACSANTNDLATDIQTCLDGDPEVCTISNAIASFNDCTETEYSITLAVMGENLGTSFTVSDAAGNDLGTYNYADMPVDVSGIPVTESILTITDSESTDCTSNTNDLATDIQTCVEGFACSISSAIAMVSSCTENDYSAMIMVAGENTGTTFSVTDAAGNDLGTFNYADSPIVLSGLALTSNVFTITDGDDAGCSATSNDLAAAIEICVGEPEPTCSAMAMAMLSACTETDYTLMLMVTSLNAGDSFTVTNASGTDLGTYNYADSPIEISGVALSDHVFIITDSNDSSCVATTNNIAAEIQACTEPPPTGECSVSYSDISIVECDDNTFTVEVSVSGINVGETFKAVSLNGVSAGNFLYTESPHQISNLPIDQNWLYFIDNTDKSCATMVNLQDRIDTCLGGGSDDCTLDVSAGFLTIDNDYICDGDSPATNLVDTSLPQGYNTYYVFHNNANLTPASLSNTQVYAVSNSDLDLENSLIPCGTPIYMTAMIAEQTLNISDLDLSALCTTFGNTVEIVFLCPISVSIEELCNQATGLFVLNVVVKGGLPAFEVESEFDISGDVYNGNTGNEELISIVDLPDGSDYRIVATDEYGCTTEVSGNISCEKKLPVELITFTGEAKQNGNLLKWSTASEIQNDFFTIEHSTDAINYTKLKVIEGAGTSNEATNYEFLDRAAANGTTYYRLSQTDFDGTSKVEGVVFITRGEDIGINIAGINPMPFVNELNIQLSSTENVFVRFSLTDLSGRLMIRNEYNLISGLTEISLDTEQLAMGIYMLRIETKTGSIVKKVVKH